MDQKAKIERMRRTLGGTPECLGRYRPDLAECIDECAWHDVCPVYRNSCRERGVDPHAERASLDSETFHALVFQLYTKALNRKEVRGTRAVARRGWQRFLNAMQDALGFEIHSAGEIATLGDLYVRGWASKDPHIAKVYYIKVKTSAGFKAQPVFARYHPLKLSRLQPVVEIRCHLDTIFERYPHAIELASRWRLRYMTTYPIGAVAIGVLPDRIEDMARLNVRLLEDGLTRGLRLAGDKIRILGKGES